MNSNDILICDFETGSLSIDEPQPIELAAIHLDPRRLVLGETFCTLIKPRDFTKVEAQALAVNKKTIEELHGAPTLEQVFPDFANFVNKFNKQKSPYNAPIMAGYNILNFDFPIMSVLCKEFKYWDHKRNQQKLFSNFMTIDVMQLTWFWMFENSYDLSNLKFDTVRGHVGLSTKGSHAALKDVQDTGELLIKYMKFMRNIGKNAKFKGSFLREKMDVIQQVMSTI